MCSRVLATIFIIYCLNTGFCEDLLDLSCTVNSDCENFKRPAHNVSCSEEKCICSDINSGQHIKCEPVNVKQNNIVSGPCPCTMKNSTCDTKSNICLCIPDYIASFDKRRCIKKIVPIGGACEDNSQCVSADHFSYCDPVKKQCNCLEHFVEHNGECLSALALDETCIDHVQCANSTAYSMCSGKKCICSPGLVANKLKSKCLLSVDYFEACNETNQCKNKLGFGSICNDYVCTCDAEHNPVNVTKDGKEQIKCRRNVVFGDYCTNNKDCHIQDVKNEKQNLDCFLGECRCRDGLTEKGGVCEQSGARKIVINGFYIVFVIAVSTTLLV